MHEIDSDENKIPANTDTHVPTAQAEIGDLQKQPDHCDNAQPENPGHQIGQCNDGVGQRAGQVSQGKKFQHVTLNSCSSAKFAF